MSCRDFPTSHKKKKKKKKTDTNQGYLTTQLRPYRNTSSSSPLTHFPHTALYAFSKSRTQRLVSKSGLFHRCSNRIFRISINLPPDRPRPSYLSPKHSRIARSSYSSSVRATNSSWASFPAGVLVSGNALPTILDAIREQSLCLCRGKVNSGVPLHSTSVAVVCALHSGVSTKRSRALAREMCSFLGATSVKMSRDAVSWPAHAAAVSRRFLSPTSGNRRSQRTEFGMRARIRNHVRNVVGSIYILSVIFLSFKI